MTFEIRDATPGDHDELFDAFAQIVASGDGFPQASPISRADFDDYWIDHASSVCVVRIDGRLVGAYYVKPNFVGRAAHIANAGYFVLPAHRGVGLGRALVEHSLGEARRAGFDAMQFNLVFGVESRQGVVPRLGFAEIGRIPHAVDGEDAVIYWCSLETP